MTKKSKYIDRILVRLKRQYSKDEYVAALLKKYSELEIENGVLRSERDEAIYNLEKTLKLPSKIKAQIGQRTYYRRRIQEIKSLREKLKKLKLDYDNIFQELIKCKNS